MGGTEGKHGTRDKGLSRSRGRTSSPRRGGGTLTPWRRSTCRRCRACRRRRRTEIASGYLRANESLSRRLADAKRRPRAHDRENSLAPSTKNGNRRLFRIYLPFVNIPALRFGIHLKEALRNTVPRLPVHAGNFANCLLPGSGFAFSDLTRELPRFPSHRHNL